MMVLVMHMSVTGNSVQAAGYILGGQDLQTLTYNFSEVTGNLIIEGTLASTPVDDDWFRSFSYNSKQFIQCQFKYKYLYEYYRQLYIYESKT